MSGIQKIIDRLKIHHVAISVSILVFVFTWAIFTQYLGTPNTSDWVLHAAFALSPNYSIPPHFLLHLIIMVTGKSPAAYALIPAASKTACVIIIAKFYLPRSLGRWSAYFLSALICFAMPVLFLAEDPRAYLGKFSPNVVHNPTYILMTPFMLGLWYYYTRRIISGRVIAKNWLIGLAILGLLTALAKPSFHLPFILTASLISIWALLMRRQKFWPLIVAGLALSVPIIWQIFAVSSFLSDDQQSRIIIAPFEALSIYVKDPKGAFISSFAFPIFVLLTLAIRKTVRAEIVFSWVLLGFAFLIAIFFGEEGDRMRHANFYWGIYAANLILFAEGASVLNISYRNEISPKITPYALIVMGLGLLILCVHTYYGLTYHFDVAGGKNPFQ